MVKFSPGTYILNIKNENVSACALGYLCLVDGRSDFSRTYIEEISRKNNLEASDLFALEYIAEAAGVSLSEKIAALNSAFVELGLNLHIDPTSGEWLDLRNSTKLKGAAMLSTRR